MRGPRGSMMIVDGGKVCPDYLPAHGHADTLSYELWVGGRHIITDSGTYAYEEGEWRDYFRGTSAHNTVVVDRQNSSQVWSSFRIGSRAFPEGVSWASSEEGDWFVGRHDGYRKLRGGVVHQREVVYLRGLWWLVVDTVHGEGDHQLESLVHLHPDVKIEKREQDGLWVNRDGHGVSLRAFGHQSFDIEEGWYSPEFGIKHKRNTLRFANTGDLPHRMGYLMVEGDDEGAVVHLDLDAKDRVAVRVGDCSWTVFAERSASGITVRAA